MSSDNIKEFAFNIDKFDDIIVRDVFAKWNKNTLLAMGKAQVYSPVRTGNLQGSARRITAKITPTGIKSEFRFIVRSPLGYGYAPVLEKGYMIKKGKRINLNINTGINPLAQSGYAERARQEQVPFFMKDLNSAISEAWKKV